MSKKPKLKPEITRVELNPEQAVLACTCYYTGWQYVQSARHYEGTRGTVCNSSARSPIYSNIDLCTDATGQANGFRSASTVS